MNRTAIQGGALGACLSGLFHLGTNAAHLIWVAGPDGVVARGLVGEQLLQIVVKYAGYIAIGETGTLYTGENSVAKALVAVPIAVPIQPHSGGGADDLVGEEVVCTHGGDGAGGHSAACPNTHTDAAAVLTTDGGYHNLSLFFQSGDLFTQILHHFCILREVTGSQNDALFGVDLDISTVLLLCDHTGDTISRLHQLFAGGFPQKFCTVLLGDGLIQLGCFGQTGNAGEFGAARPEFEAGDVPGEVLIGGPVGHHNGVLLLLRKGLDHPVKCVAGGSDKLHYQLGVGAVIAPYLPVI